MRRPAIGTPALPVQKQRLEVALEQIAGDVLADDRRMGLERIGVDGAEFGRQPEADVDELPEIGVERGAGRVVLQGADELPAAQASTVSADGRLARLMEMTVA